MAVSKMWVGLFVAALFLGSVAPGSSKAENIVYDGSNPGMLQTNPIAAGTAIYPTGLSGNTVTVTASGPGSIFGGLALGNEDVRNNTVNVSNAIVATIRGGHSEGGGIVENNTVNFFSGSTIDLSGGYSIGGNAINNSVILDGGSVHLEVSGGYSAGGDAIGNTVIVYDAAVGTHVAGGETDIGNAVKNTVIVNAGSVADIYGGLAFLAGNATDNIVSLAGGTITGDVWGGHAPAGDAFTGNTLNVSNRFTFNSLNNFEFLNFNLPEGFQANNPGDAMLTVAATSLGGASTVSSINVARGSSFAVGDTVALINSTGVISGSLAKNTAQGLKGAALVYDWDVNLAANSLTATLTGISANPQLKGPSQGALAGTALINEGGNLAAEQGISSAVDATCQKNPKGDKDCTGLIGFSALRAGFSRYNTGSHVDMTSFSFLAGLAWGQELNFGRLTLGTFFEAGSGSYNTYSSFSNAASVDGDGKARYLGGGLLARMDFAPAGPGHFYVEGTARTGGLYNHYNTSDLHNAMNQSDVGYDRYSAYYGLHGGGGYVWNLTEALALDMYGKYFWTRQEGNSVTLSTGDPVDFDDVNSNRLRMGSRLTYTLNDYVNPYVGAAYEHEFDGKASASTYGYSIKSPTLRGDTGIGELGLSLRPSQAVPLTLDLSVQGYVGRREGVSGNAQIKFDF